MAKVVTAPGVRSSAIKRERWQEQGEHALSLQLDRNEALAVRNAVAHHRHATDSRTEPTSLHGSGARVYEALNEIVRANGWA